jgi:hypothetical protein
MSTYNSDVHAAVSVTFVGGTTDPVIVTDPTSGLAVAFNVASVARKGGEPVGVYIVTMAEPVAEVSLDPRLAVLCEADGKKATLHPSVDGDGLVASFEIRGTYTEAPLVGTLADIMFVLVVKNQWIGA